MEAGIVDEAEFLDGFKVLGGEVRGEMAHGASSFFEYIITLSE